MHHRRKPGPQQQLPPILQLLAVLMNHRAAAVVELQPSGQEGPQVDVGARGARIRKLRIIAGGAAVAGVPAGSATGWAIQDHSGVILYLAIVSVITAAATAVAIYETLQETKRMEIECYSANTIAAAAARYIDSTHEHP